MHIHTALERLIEPSFNSSSCYPAAWLIPYNNTNATKNNNNIMNGTKVDANKTIADQYIITLKDNSITRTPNGLEDVLNNLSAKVEGEGAKVISVYKYSIKGLTIKVPNQQIVKVAQRSQKQFNGSRYRAG
jgi:hypothetical protein